MTKIAILGKGQLATMLTESVSDLPLEITTFALPKIDQDGHSNSKEIAQWAEALKAFNVVTYEIENISADLLEAVSQSTTVYPAVDALQTAQDRLLEKTLFNTLNIKTNNFVTVSSKDDLVAAAQKLGLPLVLKTRRFGYDGKGQYIIKGTADLKHAWSALGDKDLLAESFVPFDFEISQVASRDQSGHIAFYPLVRNEHREGILRETYVLPQTKEFKLLKKQAQQAVEKILTYFDYVGTFAMEFFVQDGGLLANEVAPRVHNSGHWSIDGANVSQFRNHMLAVSGKKTLDVKVKASNILMINLIGEDVPQDITFPANTTTKSYQKSVRPARKMGHINIVDQNEHTFVDSKNSVYQAITAKAC